jgi:hypothetical protein
MNDNDKTGRSGPDARDAWDTPAELKSIEAKFRPPDIGHHFSDF